MENLLQVEVDRWIKTFEEPYHHIPRIIRQQMIATLCSINVELSLDISDKKAVLLQDALGCIITLQNKRVLTPSEYDNCATVFQNLGRYVLGNLSGMVVQKQKRKLDLASCRPTGMMLPELLEYYLQRLFQ